MSRAAGRYVLGCTFYCLLDKLIEADIIYVQGDIKKPHQLSRMKANLY